MNEQDCKALIAGMGNQIVQDPKEFWGLVQAVQGINPKKILEIGTDFGGTLRFWQLIAGQEGQAYGVDDRGINSVDMSGYPAPLMLVGDSQDEEMVGRVREHAPFDFLFIDADHSYEGCKRDWENYSPMVRVGGLVGFHDYNHPPVRRVFDEIQVGTKEYFDITMGIGIVRMPT